LKPKAAFLDRDGVLNSCILRNGSPSPPSDVTEVEILPGVLEAIELLNQNGYLSIVVTNQPDISRGTTSLSQVQEINVSIERLIGVSHFYVCPHDDVDNCNCRKPKPGLIDRAVNDLGIDLERSFLVGDRWRDIEAGQSLGLPSFFIDYSYNELKPKPPFTQVFSLLEAVEIWIGVESGFSNQ
jgi:D-glycero-D-manno-heptose 1,7-bisphosphate phosphatase